MYRHHRLAPVASSLLLLILVAVFALGSVSEVTAEEAQGGAEVATVAAVSGGGRP